MAVADVAPAAPRAAFFRAAAFLPTAPPRRAMTRPYWLPQSIWQISADRPAKFQFRPNARKRDLSALATVTFGAIQYSEFLITTFSPRFLPRTGVIAPSMILSTVIRRVWPSRR